MLHGALRAAIRAAALGLLAGGPAAAFGGQGLPFERLDRDADGAIVPAEAFRDLSPEGFAQADADGDWRLTREEYGRGFPVAEAPAAGAAPTGGAALTAPLPGGGEERPPEGEPPATGSPPVDPAGESALAAGAASADRLGALTAQALQGREIYDSAGARLGTVIEIRRHRALGRLFAVVERSEGGESIAIALKALTLDPAGRLLARGQRHLPPGYRPEEFVPIEQNQSTLAELEETQGAAHLQRTDYSSSGPPPAAPGAEAER